MMAPILHAAFILSLADPSASTPEPADAPDRSELRWRLHAEASFARGFFLRHDGGFTRTLSAGIPGVFALGFGRAIGDGHVVVGTRASGLVEHTGVDGAFGGEPWVTRTVRGGGSLLPYVEVRPLPRLRVQPFVLVEGGVGLYAARRRTLEGVVSSMPGCSLTVTPTVGGRGGLHAFVRPRLSIDADVGVRREWRFQWMRDPTAGPEDLGEQALRMHVAGTVGLSGWW